MKTIKTPFMKAEDRMMAQFAAEVEALGIKADTRSFGGCYAKDGAFILELQTEPEPLKGNKAKVEALREAGYYVDVYAPNFPFSYALSRSPLPADSLSIHRFLAGDKVY